ncbi:uncharacterized protein [Anabrus simplex]|uniref:uncharacterized protein n=1 Tax=Anabrus simplex TaxID=316456 RepID=UPI0035A39410
MGNHHSHEGSDSHLPNPRGSLRNDLPDRMPTQLVPIDKLAKILVQKSLEEDSLQGISCRVFTKYVFPRYPDLAERLYKFFLSSAENTRHSYLTQNVFKQQAERFLGVISDEAQIEAYVKMYSERNEVKEENFRQLLLAAYRLAMDHYPDGPTTCTQLHRTLAAVIDSAFHRKTAVPTSYLVHWIEHHCPRLIVSIHRYVVHVLSTAYRALGRDDNEPSGLELSTPVLERELNFTRDEEDVLPLSQVWLLATVLPNTFTRPSPHHSPVSSANGLSSQNYIAKMLGSICPSHWVPLYNSGTHGLGANRFVHHVFNYRGPTVTILRGEQGVEFCIAADTEWKETHQYWGGEDCMVLQMLPQYHVIERGPKLLYFNTSIRGYPKALRAGLDPRKPAIDVCDGFSVIKYLEIPYTLNDIEVWGCGTEQSREAQLEVKKWEVKQAERQRQVKLRSEDWLDHPDRYLLELAGRQTYASSSDAQSSS